MDKKLQALVDAPLEDANKLYLPEGRRPAKRAPKPVYIGNALGEKLTGKQLTAMKEKAQIEKMRAVLDHYSQTTVPFERVAAHTGLTLERVKEAMSYPGSTE